MFQELLRHWLVIQVLGVLAMPLSGLLFRSLPDRGYAFAKTLGLLVTGYGAWLLAMLGLAPFSTPLLAAVALAMAGSGWFMQRGRARVAPLRAALPGRLTLLGYEALFLAVLFATAWMRTYEPVPWGTERPMDFAFFNAIQQSGTFPPADPWLAGYSINYYYLGYLLMAAVSMLAGQAPAGGYNLSLALIAALTALGAAGLTVNLIRLTVQGRSHDEQAAGSRRARFPLPTFLFPLLAALFVLLAGNQAGALQVIVGNEKVVALDGGQLLSAVAQALGGAQTIALPSPAPTGEFGRLTTLERSDRWHDFNWWWPSRALWDSYGGQDGAAVERRYTITEFPFFSFRLGDMHPHVMALPFGVLALALALAVVARRDAPLYAVDRVGWTELLLSGLILGSLYMINSWDLPTYLLLFAAALWLLHKRLAGNEPLPWGLLARRLGLVIGAALVLFLPFFLTFRSLVGGAEPLIDLPLIGGLTRMLGIYTGGRSGLHAFLVIFGLFVLPISALIYLIRPHKSAAVAETERRSGAALGLVAGSTTTDQRWSPAMLQPWLAPGLLLIGLVIGFPLLALAGLGWLALGRALQLRERPGEAFAMLAAALGCAICFGTELVYIRDVFEGWSQRFNTIFKFYYQVWLIWGVLAAYGLWWLLACARGRARLPAYLAAGVSLLFLAGALVYPALSLGELGRGEQQALNAPTPRELSEAGRESLDWLRRNAPPGSVILEAVEGLRPDGSRYGGSYNGEGYSGVSAASGVPTVVGWLGHQSQWRGGDPAARAELESRRSDVERIYTTLDLNEARALLHKYNVRYIYVGGLERAVYNGEGLAKFDGLGRRVFEKDDVIIYELTG